MTLSSHTLTPANGPSQPEESVRIEITPALVEQVSRKVMGLLLLDMRLENERMRAARHPTAGIGGLPCWPD